MGHRTVLVAFAVVAVLVGCRNWRHHVDPARAVNDPVQVPLEDQPPVEFDRRGYHVRLTPRATYQFAGYAVEKSSMLLDAWDFVMPLDVGVVWGPVADPAVLDRLSFHLTERYLSWRYDRDPGVSMEVLRSHVANNHLIPGDAEIGRTLDHIQIGDWVSLSGLLVDVQIRDADQGVRLN